MSFNEIPSQPNQKALVEMELAQQALREAAIAFSTAMQKLRASQSAVEEAIATSDNRDAACYQRQAAGLRQAYRGVLSVGMDMECAFRHPVLQLMIQAAQDDKSSAGL